MRKISINVLLFCFIAVLLAGCKQQPDENSFPDYKNLKTLFIINGKISTIDQVKNLGPTDIVSFEIIKDKNRLALNSKDDYDQCIIIKTRFIKWKAYSIIDDTLIYHGVLRVTCDGRSSLDLIADYFDHTFKLEIGDDTVCSLLIKYPNHSSLLITDIPTKNDSTYIGEIEILPNLYFSKTEFDSIRTSKISDLIATGFARKNAIRKADNYMRLNYHQIGHSITDSPFYVSNSGIAQTKMNSVKDKSKDVDINYSNEKNLVTISYNKINN